MKALIRSDNFPIILLLLCILLVLPAQLYSEQSKKEELQEDITKKRSQAKEQKRSLHKLSRKERELYSELAQTEKNIQKLEARLKKQKSQLQTKEQQENRLQNEYKKLEEKQESTQEDLRRLLRHLWPLHMRSRNLGLSNLKTWEEVDRQFTWLASIYSTVEEKAETLAEQSQELQHNLKEQRQLKSQISSQIDKIQTTKDKLLQDKLNYLHRMQKVRAKRLAKEEQLKMIQETVKDLQYKLKLLTTRQFAQLKGHIPWPARGNIVVSFSPSANPPQRGLGMALPSKQDIQAVSWGKVVHNDQLRGFGHVVILYHGQDYYSLYAYLSNSTVRTGQDVEKGEILGQAGFYPPAKGPGLYFELRFRQKAINPRIWLKG